MRGASQLVRKYAKIWLPLVVLGLIGGGIGIYKAINGSATGTLSQTTLKPAATAAPSAPVSVSGNYVSFSRPADYTPIAGDKLSDALFENFAYANRKLLPAADLYVSVVPLPSGNLADDSSYHFRQLNPDKYQPEAWDVGGVQVPLMDQTGGGFYKVAYVAHGSLAAEVALSCGSSANDSTLNNDLKTVLTSLKWLRNG